jgi:CubicO group peptidase (beta-lactamase class C family)
MEPVISLKTQPQQLIETEESIASIKFDLSAPPPPTGLTVSLKATNLADFSLGKAQVTGGTITLEPALQRTLQQALDGTREADVPGATIAIVSPAGSWFGASGVANIQTRTPLKVSDRFQIGSITKTFVATTVLQLVQEGKLRLDDKLPQLLPDRVTKNVPNAANITLKQLLQHTSGIADYTDVLFTQAATNPGVFLQEWQPEEVVGLINGVPPLVNPGEGWRYSSTNFVLAGLIVEATTGKTIGREIRDRILTPLNLKNTFYATEEMIPGGVVSGYWDFDRDGRLNDITGASLSWAGAAGAMVSNTQDLDTFARNLFKGNLLKPEILAQMLETVPTNEPDNYSSYGLGVGTIESTNRLWYIHRGQTLGYRSNMWYEPKEDLSYIELINGFSRDNLSRDVLRPYREGIVDEVFNFTITSQNAEIRLPVTKDNVVEGTETATFSLEPGTGYGVNSQARSGQFIITDDSALLTENNASFNIISDRAVADYIQGTAGRDMIYGLDGFNSLYGGGDRDIIFGGKDGDLIFGGTGDDLIWGGKGQDVLFGETGRDIFAFKKSEGSDIISDFKAGEDKIGVLVGEIQTNDVSFEQFGTATAVRLRSNGEILAYLQDVMASQLNSSSVIEVINSAITAAIVG